MPHHSPALESGSRLRYNETDPEHPGQINTGNGGTDMEMIWEPVSVGTLTLANRLVMPPMATAKADESGRVTEELCEYYRERAKYSKVGLIITEHSFIHMQGRAHPRQTSLADDAAIDSFRRLTACIHDENVRVFAQINHAGAAAERKTTGMATVGPSAVCHPKRPEETPQAMTTEQIHEATKWFAQAALRAKKAGFDGVEIHSAHGYLLNQFFSPLMNRRTDEYGPQSVENRTRFHREVLCAVREAVGREFPVAVRLGGCDYTDGGSTIEDCAEACRILEACGADLIDLTGGMNGYVRAGHDEPGYFRDMSAAVKRTVRVPVLLTGGITTVAQAEQLLEDGCADLIGVGRAIFRNPHWAD